MLRLRLGTNEDEVSEGEIEKWINGLSSSSEIDPQK
jgi:hypothetical protein